MNQCSQPSNTKIRTGKTRFETCLHINQGVVAEEKEKQEAEEEIVAMLYMDCWK
jgi:hypothetical protein